MSGYDYVAVGHVTADVLLDARGREQRQPGGGAFYSGLQAARLGLRTLILTRGEPAELAGLLAPFSGELALEIVPAAQTTTFETRGGGHGRRQRLRAWAGPLSPKDLPVAALSAESAILHLAPVAQETPLWGDTTALTPRQTGLLVCLTPQGLVRRWTDAGEIAHCPLDPRALPGRLDAAVLSEAERESCLPLFERAQVIAVTAGQRPTTVHIAAGTQACVAPKPVTGAHDDLGAGDVFAAAFFAALRAGLSPLAAAGRGNAAAAIRIGGSGPDAIGGLDAIERLAG